MYLIYLYSICWLINGAARKWNEHLRPKTQQTLTCRAFHLPNDPKGAPMSFSIHLIVPHQELLSGFYGSTATIENSTLMLKRYQIVFIITGTVYIPEDKKIKIKKSEVRPEIKKKQKLYLIQLA